MSLAGFNLDAQLEQIETKGLYRSRRLISSAQGVEIVADGKPLINFCSNDYLGLANHPLVIQAFQQAADQFGVGSGSAHLICGHNECHHALEQELAEFTRRDRVLLFSSGYMANVGVISALIGQGDSVLEDRLNHASLLDGGLLSRARFKRYQHSNLTDLNSKLRDSSGCRLIVTDGVFSMDGDVAPVKELSALVDDKTWLVVDDAHGFGVLGETGGGTLQQVGLSQNQVPILIGTLGKSFGTMGAFVAGSEQLIELLIQKARTYIFTTAMPAAVAEATRASLKLLTGESWRRDKLQQLMKQFRQGAEQLQLPIMQTESAIQPLLIGNSLKAVSISDALFDAGFLVSAIRPPTVPNGQARLRLTFTANHTPLQIDQLLNVLENVFR